MTFISQVEYEVETLSEYSLRYAGYEMLILKLQLHVQIHLKTGQMSIIDLITSPEVT